MPRAVMEGSRLRRPFGGFRRRGRCPVGTPMPSGSGGGAVRVHSTMDGKDAPASSRRMPAPGCLFLRFQPRCSVGSRERGPLIMFDDHLPRPKAGRAICKARRSVCVQCEGNGSATKRRLRPNTSWGGMAARHVPGRVRFREGRRGRWAGPRFDRR